MPQFTAAPLLISPSPLKRGKPDMQFTTGALCLHMVSSSQDMFAQASP